MLQNFDNLDILVDLANERTKETGVHLIYSTPSCFVKV